MPPKESTAVASPPPEGSDPGALTASGAITLLPDTVGRYLLKQQLGKGSMGEVWRADDPQIGRSVAIKLLNVPEGLSAADRGEWEERFLREARAAGRLSHPGIVAIHDVGKNDEGRPYIVMELVEGRSLDRMMRDQAVRKPATVLGWGVQLAEALDAAHRRGVVHRDIKPANILIDDEGRARIADFGIARVSESELTREGLFLGSPAYASPEQIRGGTVDGRSDLFSLGATLYTLLAGVRPFRGDDMTALAYAICHVDPDPPSRHAPGLPEGCDGVLLRALAKDPSARQATAKALAGELEAVAAGRRTAPHEGTKISRSPRPAPSPSGSSERFEKRAEVAGSAAGRFVARSAVVAARAAQGAGRATVKAGKFTAPIVRRGASTALSSLARAARAGAALWTRGWKVGPRARASMVAGALVVVALLGLGGRALMARGGATASKLLDVAGWRHDEEAGDSVIVAGEGAPVTIRIAHSVARGHITVWADGRRILGQDLSADAKQVHGFGAKLLTYRKATAEWPVRLAGGSHAVRVRVTDDAVDAPLEESLTVDVDPDGRYVLDVHVRSWPTRALSLDLSRS
ncbi:MAG TPA: serine/threonine-protein kinase [Verrucomicrobiae bacterium]|nr:serine/threonine-protein kinase [Verrucomicrobiae bacterium]